MGTYSVKVYGEPLLMKFANKHAHARKPLASFLEIVRGAEWMHMPDVKSTFASADFDPDAKLCIFDIGGNKYTLTASVNFEKQSLLIEAVMTHEEYDRKE